MTQAEQSTSPTPEAAAGGSTEVRRDEQAEMSAENQQSAVEGSDDYLRRNSQGAAEAAQAVGQPVPGAANHAVGPDAAPAKPKGQTNHGR